MVIQVQFGWVWCLIHLPFESILTPRMLECGQAFSSISKNFGTTALLNSLTWDPIPPPHIPNQFQKLLDRYLARCSHLSWFPFKPLYSGLEKGRFYAQRKAGKLYVSTSFHIKTRLESVFILYRILSLKNARSKYYWLFCSSEAQISGTQIIDFFRVQYTLLKCLCTSRTADSSSHGSLKMWNQNFCSRFAASSIRPWQSTVFGCSFRFRSPLTRLSKTDPVFRKQIKVLYMILSDNFIKIQILNELQMICFFICTIIN